MNTKYPGKNVTFNEGQKVFVYDFDGKAALKTIESIECVPDDLIDYDPISKVGGVGHTQWLRFVEDTDKHPTSGVICYPVASCFAKASRTTYQQRRVTTKNSDENKSE